MPNVGRLRFGPGVPGSLAIPMLCTLAAVALGVWATLPNLHWYAGLRRPSFRPSGPALGLAWVAVYGMLLWACLRVVRSPDWMPDRSAALQSFVRQTAIHSVWPIAVFGLHRPRLGLLVAVGLLAQLVITARLFGRVDRLAGVLVLAGIAWTGFVVLLNLSLAIRN